MGPLPYRMGAYHNSGKVSADEVSLLALCPNFGTHPMECFTGYRRYDGIGLLQIVFGHDFGSGGFWIVTACTCLARCFFRFAAGASF